MSRKIKILPVRPPCYPRNYTNPKAQETLIWQSSKWPTGLIRERCFVMDPGYFGDWRQKPSEKDLAVEIDADKYGCGSTWSDHLQHQPIWSAMVECLLGGREDRCGLVTLIESTQEKNHLEAAKLVFEKEPYAVRWVYNYNQATGYDCLRLDCIYYLVAPEAK